MAQPLLTRDDLAGLVADLLARGTSVLGPVRVSPRVVEYRRVTQAADLSLGAGPLPRRPLKEHFLPPTEPLLRWRQAGGDVHLEDAVRSPGPRVVLGARPCDAAALEVVDRVMGWDYKDDAWFARREATTVVGVACTEADASCFCTAVGLAPDADRGSDLLLVPVAGGWQVRVNTPRGRALLETHRERFGALPEGTLDDPAVAATRQAVAANLSMDPAAVRRWVEANFEHPSWTRLSARCHGCGACASVCPTCHCFDIVDEPEGVDRGTRRRNWDTCQAALFTLHGSGHNPRDCQQARCRQRVNHKFAIYPARFGEILCTGCGRCVRACPAGMDLLENLAEIGRMAEETP